MVHIVCDCSMVAVHLKFFWCIIVDTSGASLQRQGKYWEAIKYHSMVLAISEREGEDSGNTEAYGAIADCYTELGDLERAAKFYDKYISRLETDWYVPLTRWFLFSNVTRPKVVMLVEFADSCWLTTLSCGSFHFCIYVKSHLMKNNILGKSSLSSRVFHLSANLRSWWLVSQLKIL